MVASRTFDGRLQLLEYVPTVLTGPPGSHPASWARTGVRTARRSRGDDARRKFLPWGRHSADVCGMDRIEAGGHSRREWPRRAGPGQRGCLWCLVLSC